jgi:hypothetical protein
MARRARSKEISRRSWLLAGFTFGLSRARGAEPLSVTYDGDTLFPIVPNLHFLSRPTAALDRLKDGNTVVFISRLSLFTIDRAIPRKQTASRFMVSYDIFEERFKVTLPGSAPRSRSGLTAAQAESWCIENIAISASGLPKDVPFFLRLELRTADPKGLSGVITEPGISILGTVAEIFSRKPGPQNPSWGPFESRPMRLSDLTPTTGRGARNG